MSVRHILKMGDPLLFNVAQSVPPEEIHSPTVQSLIQDML